jgi:hypothetical protein
MVNGEETWHAARTTCHTEYTQNMGEPRRSQSDLVFLRGDA